MPPQRGVGRRGVGALLAAAVARTLAQRRRRQGRAVPRAAADVSITFLTVIDNMFYDVQRKER